MDSVWRPSGTLPAWVRWLIALSCGVTIVVAAKGLSSLWSYGGFASTMNGSWFRNGLAVGVAAAIGLAWIFPWHMTRSLRVAVLLPLIHVVAILVTARLWNRMEHDIAAFWCCTDWHAKVAVPPVATLAIAMPALAIVAILIKRRHGEWAHAMVMLSLTCLLLVGLWLPIAVSAWIEDSGLTSWDSLHVTMEDSARFSAFVVIPPVLTAIAFTALAFRRRHLLERHRATLKICVGVLLGIALLSQISMADAGVVLYLNFVHVILIAVFLVVVALAAFGAATWIGSRLAHRALRALPREPGVIRGDAPGPVAGLEITSWLRGPRLATQAFSVRTARGEVPVAGASVLAQVPPVTTRLHVGERVALLAVGDRVEIAGHSEPADGHPFRAMDAANVAVVAVADATPYRFADVALVMWRPCIAYLAILVTVALPGLVVLVK